jgi:oxygen-dependent protoporphyrinogen oxidase
LVQQIKWQNLPVKDVAIIGGGLAGLSCAFALKRKGIRSTVFESRPDGSSRDQAAFFFLAPDLFRDTFQLIREVGLADAIISIPPHAAQVHKGRIYHHRVASATGLLSFKGLRITDKALLPRMAYLLARHSSHLDFHHPERGLEFDDESVAAFIKRELSQNVLNYIAGPLISTLFYYGSEETSRWLYFVLAKHMYNTRMSTLRGGIKSLRGRLSKELRIENHEVRSLQEEGNEYLIDGRRFSDVVVAVPGTAVLSISGMERLLSGEDIEFFRNTVYQRTVSVTVSTRAPVDRNCYAVSIPRVEGFAAATIVFHNFIDPSTVPDGRGLLTVTGGGPTVTPDQLMEELHRLYRTEPDSVDVMECTTGMPKFPPGHYRQINAFEHRSRKPGLFFCGDYLLGPFIEGAVTTGLRAAEAIRT